MPENSKIDMIDTLPPATAGPRTPPAEMRGGPVWLSTTSAPRTDQQPVHTRSRLPLTRS
ncbi:hypothetical protein FRAHR75_30161 [Frankia sp. Hr75.2]|nr:hypothetical protein FRAHR75_30161 [Frankia sp. Hr75.2]